MMYNTVRHHKPCFQIIIIAYYFHHLTKDGLFTRWYENGQKHFEYLYKNGEIVRLLVWYENGQMWKEITYKGEVIISQMEWNEDGSVKE
mgnify:CR=1 FL=1